MKVLPSMAPTPEQIQVLSDHRSGAFLIRGAAGSGKTTTALLKLDFQSRQWHQRLDRIGRSDPVRILVLTYNRTLEGYIAELARDQVDPTLNIFLSVSTFGRWTRRFLPANRSLLDPKRAAVKLREFIFAAKTLTADPAFYCDEVDYVISRFRPEGLEEYLSIKREKRGISPRMERPARAALLNEVIIPYIRWKAQHDYLDWNDLALLVAREPSQPWDIVIVDESQDFSANQIRAVRANLADEYCLTFVIDSIQRIYPRHFTWKEAGVEFRGNPVTLKRNYRNTREIADLARGLLAGVPDEEDGAMPDFKATTRSGRKPEILVGRFTRQMDHIIEYIDEEIDLRSESVAFLHPKGGGFFSYMKQRLDRAGIDWVELTRSSTWPEGDEQVALSTIHSAKGLEFDHVFILGLNQQVTPHGNEPGDVGLDTLRRLVAMGIGRARSSVVIGYSGDDPSTLIDLFDKETFTEVSL